MNLKLAEILVAVTGFPLVFDANAIVFLMFMINVDVFVVIAWSEKYESK